MKNRNCIVTNIQNNADAVPVTPLLYLKERFLRPDGNDFMAIPRIIQSVFINLIVDNLIKKLGYEEGVISVSGNCDFT